MWRNYMREKSEEEAQAGDEELKDTAKVLKSD